MVVSKYNKIFNVDGRSFVYNMSSKALMEIDQEMESFLKGETKEIKEDFRRWKDLPCS